MNHFFKRIKLRDKSLACLIQWAQKLCDEEFYSVVAPVRIGMLGGFVVTLSPESVKQRQQRLANLKLKDRAIYLSSKTKMTAEETRELYRIKIVFSAREWLSVLKRASEINK